MKNHKCDRCAIGAHSTTCECCACSPGLTIIGASPQQIAQMQFDNKVAKVLFDAIDEIKNLIQAPGKSGIYTGKIHEVTEVIYKLINLMRL